MKPISYGYWAEVYVAKCGTIVARGDRVNADEWTGKICKHCGKPRVLEAVVVARLMTRRYLMYTEVVGWEFLDGSIRRPDTHNAFCLDAIGGYSGQYD